MFRKQKSKVTVANNQLNSAVILGWYTGEGNLNNIKTAEDIKRRE